MTSALPIPPADSGEPPPPTSPPGCASRPTSATCTPTWRPRTPASSWSTPAARQAWEQGHLPGAVHLPTGRSPPGPSSLIPAGRAGGHLLLGARLQRRDPGRPGVRPLGYPVKEMIGGYEYWVREGFGW